MVTHSDRWNQALNKILKRLALNEKGDTKGRNMKLSLKMSLIVMVVLLLLLPLQACTSSTTTSSPLQIVGSVNVTNSIQDYSDVASDPILIPAQGDVFWVVHITITNKSYPDQDLANWFLYSSWAVSDGTNLYNPPEIFKGLDNPNSGSALPSGKAGHCQDCFEVPASLSLSKAQLVFCEQQPYIYGKLSGGSKITGYDFVLQESVTEPSTNTNK